MIEEPDHWQDYQHIRDWIEKLLRRDPERAYTRAQREAVGRIIATRTPFVGWGGFSVPELIVAARKYVADYDYEDEIFLNELHEKGATRLALFDMRRLIGLCVVNNGRAYPKREREPRRAQGKRQKRVFVAHVCALRSEIVGNCRPMPAACTANHDAAAVSTGVMSPHPQRALCSNTNEKTRLSGRAFPRS